MRQASLLVLLLGVLLVAAGPVAAQDDNATANETAGNETAGDGATGNETTDGGEPAPTGPVTINLVGHQEGSSFYFTLEGETQRNPRLVVPPGAEVTVILRSATGTHNFHPEGMEPSAYASEGGEPVTYTFTAPAEPTTLQYWCDPHRSAGMVGVLQVGEAAPAEPGGDAPDVQGETVDLGDLGYADCAGFLIPASAARGAVGGPTVEDYVRLCREGEAPTERGTHAADYVIPASFALIALGVVGVVWVHRFYRP